MDFSYNPTRNKSGIAPYRVFLRSQPCGSELPLSAREAANRQLLEIRCAISQSSSDIQHAIGRAVSQVSGSLELGFDKALSLISETQERLLGIEQGIDDLNWQLTDMTNKLDGLSHILDSKLSGIIEQQKVANDLLRLIASAASLPDRKKENIFLVQRGSQFLKAAMEEGPSSGHFAAALREFEAAHRIDPTDCVAMKQLGFVHLHSLTHLNVVKAKRYFLEAATNAAGLYVGSSDTSMGEIAESCYYYASICSYIANDLPDAIEKINSAIRIGGKDRSRFQLAKYYATTGKGHQATAILREVLERDMMFALEISHDQAFISCEEVRRMLQDDTCDLISMVDTELRKFKDFLSTRSNPGYEGLVSRIEEDYRPKSYITARIAKERLKI